MAIVKAARERYDGVPRPPIQRNPWNEIECGGHYARAMSSWALLLALSGWDYDGPRKSLLFAPRSTPEEFKSFFAGPEGWGSARQSRQGRGQSNEFLVCEGRLDLAELALSPGVAPAAVKARLAGKALDATFIFASGLARVSFKTPVQVKAGQSLAVELSS